MAGPIICGVDDSDHARKAVRVAAHLAAQVGAPLQLVHVAPPAPPVLYGVAFDLDAFRQAAEQEANELLEEAAALCEGQEGTRRIVWNQRPAAALARLAEQEGAQLLVLGSHGRGALGELLLGSVTQQLLAGASCPLVIVPPSAGVETSDGS